MADNNFQRPPRKKNALDHRKLNLSARNDQGKMASLIWGLYSNNPRLTVYTNVEGDRDNGRMSANLDTRTFYSLLILLKRAIEFKATAEVPDFKVKVNNQRPNFKPGGGRPDGNVDESELWVGKDKEGVIFLAVTAYNRPKIKFPFIPSEYHQFFHGSGEQFSKSEASALSAEAYLELLKPMVAMLQVTEWKDPDEGKERRGGNGGGNNGGGYQRGNGGGGYGNRGNGGGGNHGGGGSNGGDSDGFDSDDAIPF